VKARLPWLALLALALIEVVGHATLRARVPPMEDWRAAATWLRGELRQRDAVVAAPEWSDPILRRVIGDRIPFSVAGRSDLAPFDRLWAISIRGAVPEDAPDREPDFDRGFGRVRVLRWDLPRSTVLYDFVDRVRDAEVEMVEGGLPRPCRYTVVGARGGGLGAGPMWPAERHQCDQRRNWLFVAATVNEDLELRPRHCIWQHPSGREPIRATWRNVPLGRSLVLYGDIYYEHERKLENGPVEARVLIGGEEVARMTHRDGDGWKRVSADTRSGGATGERGDVTVEVTAANPHLRTFCWSATTRSSPP
jgi:hypothetical protein